MAEGGSCDPQEKTSIDDLVAETESIQFEILGSNPEEGLTEVIRSLNDFHEDFKRKLYVIEEETRKSIYVDGELVEGDEEIENDDDKDKDANVEDGKKNDDDISPKEAQETSDEDEQKALKTMRDIKKDLKALRSFDVNESALEERSGGCYRLRTSPSVSKPQRPKSSFPILETSKLLKDDFFKKPNYQKSNKPKFDMDTLQQDLANLLMMADSPVDPSLLDREEPISPRPMPATPPCTPSNAFITHPLSPSEVRYMRSRSHTLSHPPELITTPPTKPPRQHLQPRKTSESNNIQGTVDPNQTNDQTSPDLKQDQQSSDQTTADQMDSQSIISQVPAGLPPPKPPRMNSINAINKLKLQMGKLPKSMNNIASTDDPQARIPPTEPSTPQTAEIETSDVGLSIGEKMGKVFSKFNLKKRTTKKPRANTQDPEDLSDEQASLITNEQPVSLSGEQEHPSPEETQEPPFSENQTTQEVDDIDGGGEVNTAFLEEEAKANNQISQLSAYEKSRAEGENSEGNADNSDADNISTVTVEELVALDSSDTVEQILTVVDEVKDT